MREEFRGEASLRAKAERIYRAALRAVDAERIVLDSVRNEGGRLSAPGGDFDLNGLKRILLISAGKAALPMTRALSGVLGGRLTEGLVVCPAGEDGNVEDPRLRLVRAAHPLPDARSVEAALAALAVADGAGPDDLVIVCLSGGASSLMSLPAGGVTIEEKAAVVKALLRSGADIKELNTVRKHLSGIKGGRLARAVFPAESLTLAVSDVVGDDLSVVGSGPTYWDDSTFAEAAAVLKRQGLWDSVPESAREHIRRGEAGLSEETVRKTDGVFERAHIQVIGNNRRALEAARAEAEAAGFEARVLSDRETGEARDAAREYLKLLVEHAASRGGRSVGLCLLAGGELTVTVRGGGRGGRNSEFVLAFLSALQELYRPDSTGTAADLYDAGWLVLSLGTDGIDGPTDAAGAWAGASTLGRALELGLDPRRSLDDNDSYGFFKRTGNLIFTGPTGTNVMDLRMLLIAGKP